MHRKHRLIVALCTGVTGLASVGLLGGTGTATAGSPEASSETAPWLDIQDGMTQPVFSPDKAIRESIYVQTTVDSDSDGRLDRVHLALSRPAETESKDIDVPVIFEHSPYRFGIGGAQNHNVDFDVMPQEYIQPNRTLAGAGGNAVHKAAADLPGGLDDYWLPRGYAVVLGESVGTGASDGCPTSGDDAETRGTKAIIDWLNGRAKAWNEDGEPVEADWTTGKVGMIGTSYNGTLPNMVATTGVEGLETIVPVSAISSWYDYYRDNGLVVAPHSEESGIGDNAYLGEDLDVLANFVGGPSRVDRCAHVYDRMRANQDRITGDYSSFWNARDYLHRADNVEASVFVVHGLEDYNVGTKAFASWWGQLAKNHVPRKIWLHKDGHGGPQGTTTYQETLNRWFGHWLYALDNGIMDEPRAKVQRPDGRYHEYADWPVPGSKPVTFELSAPDATDPGTLSRDNRKGPRPRQSFVDRGRQLDTDSSLVPNPAEAHPNRLVYLTSPLAERTHLSGTPEVSLRAAVDNRYAANLTAVLVDYGPRGTEEPPVIVTRGWMDVQNRRSATKTKPIQQGKEYKFRWELQPDDYVFEEGHRVGLVVVSTDQDYTVRPKPGTELTVFPAKSGLTLPLVTGRAR